MKRLPVKIPVVIRVFVFILAIMLASLPINAIYSGQFDEGNHGQPFQISMARDPLAFWVLVIVFLLLSAGLFCVAFARKFPDN